jgi:hypothetical protein
MTRFVSSVLFVLVLAGGTVFAQTQCPNGPPPYELLRQDEDYSYLSNPACGNDYWDRLKYVQLGSGRSNRYTTSARPRWCSREAAARRLSPSSNRRTRQSFSIGRNSDGSRGSSQLRCHLDAVQRVIDFFAAHFAHPAKQSLDEWNWIKSRPFRNACRFSPFR